MDAADSHSSISSQLRRNAALRKGVICFTGGHVTCDMKWRLIRCDVLCSPEAPSAAKYRHICRIVCSCLEARRMPCHRGLQEFQSCASACGIRAVEVIPAQSFGPGLQLDVIRLAESTKCRFCSTRPQLPAGGPDTAGARRQWRWRRPEN